MPKIVGLSSLLDFILFFNFFLGQNPHLREVLAFADRPTTASSIQAVLFSLEGITLTLTATIDILTAA